MKKLILSLALLAGSSAVALAQDAPRFGIKAGANYTKFSGDTDAIGDIEYKFGVVGGLAANFAFSESLSFQPELLYSMKGAELKGGGGLDDYTFKMNYLDLPLMLRYSLNDGVGPFIQAGPQLGYYLNGKISDGDGNEVDIEDGDVQKLELGYVAAVGYQTEMGLSIEARFNGGINSINKDDKALDQLRNRVFSLQLGYMFGGK